MAITKGAKKAHKQSLAKRLFNDRRSREMKKLIKDVRKLIDAKDKKGAEGLIPTTYKAIDKAAKRGIIKDNNASRKKSRLVAAIKKIA
jgi:small subunit ribosomal protein S20